MNMRDAIYSFFTKKIHLSYSVFDVAEFRHELSLFTFCIQHKIIVDLALLRLYTTSIFNSYLYLATPYSLFLDT